MTWLRRLRHRPAPPLGLVLAGCDGAPDEAAVREVLNERLAAALKPPVTEVMSFRRLGSGPLPAAADGKARRIVYYNAILKLTQDVDFASWNGLNATAFATLLRDGEGRDRDRARRQPHRGRAGARQRHLRRPGRHLAGGALGGAGAGHRLAREQHWAAQRGQAGARPDPGPARGGGERELRGGIVAEELAKAYGLMQLRIDRLDRDLVVAGGQAMARMRRHRRRYLRAWAGGPRVAMAGSFENVRMVNWERPTSAWCKATSRPPRRRDRARSPPTA